MENKPVFRYPKIMRHAASVIILVMLVALHGVAIKTGVLSQLEQVNIIELAEGSQDLQAHQSIKCCEKDHDTLKVKTAHCFADNCLEAGSDALLAAGLKDLHSPLPFSHSRFDAYGTLFRPPIA